MKINDNKRWLNSRGCWHHPPIDGQKEGWYIGKVGNYKFIAKNTTEARKILESLK